MSKKEVQVSPALIGFVVLLVLVGPVLLRCVKTVDPGYVSVATFFGEVQKETYGPGLHFPVNPLLSFTEFDVRNKEHKERIGVPSQDQLKEQRENRCSFDERCSDGFPITHTTTHLPAEDVVVELVG